jgi:hypothetical protein
MRWGMRDDVQRTRQLQDSRKSSTNFIGKPNAFRSSPKEMEVVDDVEEHKLFGREILV